MAKTARNVLGTKALDLALIFDDEIYHYLVVVAYQYLDLGLALLGAQQMFADLICQKVVEASMASFVQLQLQ